MKSKTHSSRTSFLAVTVTALCTVLCALLLSLGGDGASAQKIDTPPVFMPLNLVDAPGSVEQQIRVTERRSYWLDLNFFYSGQDDMPHVQKIAGDGTRYADGRYAEPGIAVKVHVRVVAEDGDARHAVLFDKTVVTEGHHSHVFTQAGAGYYARRIGGVVLTPGTYRVSVSTDTPLLALSGIKTNVSVTYNPRF